MDTVCKCNMNCTFNCKNYINVQENGLLNNEILKFKEMKVKLNKLEESLEDHINKLRENYDTIFLNLNLIKRDQHYIRIDVDQLKDRLNFLKSFKLKA